MNSSAALEKQKGKKGDFRDLKKKETRNWGAAEEQETKSKRKLNKARGRNNAMTCLTSLLE